MKKIISILICFSFLCTPALAAKKNKPVTEPPKSVPSQSKIYERQNKQRLMEAIINVLQDDGFTLVDTNTQLGVIAAKKEFTKKERLGPFKLVGCCVGFGLGLPLAILTFGILSPMPIYYGSKIIRGTNNLYITEATINVSSQGKVKIALSEKLTKNEKNFLHSDQYVEVKAFADEKVYQEFYSKVDKELVRKDI